MTVGRDGGSGAAVEKPQGYRLAIRIRVATT